MKMYCKVTFLPGLLRKFVTFIFSQLRQILTMCIMLHSAPHQEDNATKYTWWHCNYF